MAKGQQGHVKNIDTDQQAPQKEGFHQNPPISVPLTLSISRMIQSKLPRPRRICYLRNRLCPHLKNGHDDA